MSEIALPWASMKRRRQRRVYLFLPLMRVPHWIEDYGRNEFSNPDWKPGFGRFCALTLAIRKSDVVCMWPIGIGPAVVFKVDDGTTIIGSPTKWMRTFLFGECVIKINGPTRSKVEP